MCELNGQGSAKDGKQEWHNREWLRQQGTSCSASDLPTLETQQPHPLTKCFVSVGATILIWASEPCFLWAPPQITIGWSPGRHTMMELTTLGPATLRWPLVLELMGSWELFCWCIG